MKEIKETCYKGTRILLGNEKRVIINKMTDMLVSEGFTEINIPIIQTQEMFSNKVGEENNNMMFNFRDRGERDLCLAPEYTAVIQKLSKTTFKQNKDVKIFYVAECFRGEKPQAGRYRQFTQLGVEVINPTRYYDLPKLATELIDCLGVYMFTKYQIYSKPEFEKEFTINLDATRGLDYYKEGKGFEITCDKLGSSKQVCGGGEYDGGIGFAIGIDRLLTILPSNNWYEQF